MSTSENRLSLVVPGLPRSRREPFDGVSGSLEESVPFSYDYPFDL